MNRAKKKKASFLKGLLTYAVFFLSISVIGLIVLFRFLDEYERTRPERAVEQYMAAFDIEHLKDAEKDFLLSLDTNIQPSDVSFKIIRSFLEPGVREVKDPANSTDDKISYVLKCEDSVIGSFELRQAEAAAFGLKPWYVSREDFDFSFLLKEAPAPITVPTDYSVYCNGFLLDDSYLVKNNIKFDYLKDYYDMGYTLPYLCTYQIGEYLSEIEVEVRDETGAVTETYNDNVQEEYLQRCCDEAKKAEITSFINDFIDKYVAFTGSSKWNYTENYNALESFMLKGSDLQIRTYNTIDSLVFGTYRNNVITEIDIRKILDLGNGQYMCDLTYFVDCWGTMGFVNTENIIRLIVQDTDGGIKATEIPEKATYSSEEQAG